MFLLLSTALAAEGPLAVTGGEVLFHASDLRGPLDPYNFGVRVGDDDMLAAYKTLNRQRKAVGWAGFGVGMYGLSIFGGEVMGDLVSGVAPELVPGLIVLGAITGALGGPLLVYGSKVLYNDVSRWYDRDEAEGWAAGPQREARGPEVEIHPTALVVRW